MSRLANHDIPPEHDDPTATRTMSDSEGESLHSGPHIKRQNPQRAPSVSTSGGENVSTDVNDSDDSSYKPPRKRHKSHYLRKSLTNSAERSKTSPLNNETMDLMAGDAVYIVTGEVNSWSEKWVLPKALAENTSTLFRLEGGKKRHASKHANEITIEVEPTMFRLYVPYLYTGDFSTSELHSDYITTLFPEARAWVLREGADNGKFQSCAMEKLLKVKELMNVATINYVYNWTHNKSSCLHNYVVARVGFYLLNSSELGGREDDWEELMVNNGEFAGEIFRWLRKPGKERLPPADTAKEYYKPEDRDRTVT